MISPSLITVDDIKEAVYNFLNPGIIVRVPVECFTFTNEFLFIGTSTGGIKIIQLATKLEGFLDGHETKVSSIQLTKDSQFLVSGSYDGWVKL